MDTVPIQPAPADQSNPASPPESSEPSLIVALPEHSWLSRPRETSSILYLLLDKVFLTGLLLLAGVAFNCQMENRKILAEYQKSMFSSRLQAYENLLSLAGDVRTKAIMLYAEEDCLQEHQDVLQPMLIRAQYFSNAGRAESLQVITKSSDLMASVMRFEAAARSTPLYVSDDVRALCDSLLLHVRIAATRMDPTIVWSMRMIRSTISGHTVTPGYARSDSVYMMVGKELVGIALAPSSGDPLLEARIRRQAQEQLDSLSDVQGTTLITMVCSRYMGAHHFNSSAELKPVHKAYVSLLEAVKSKLRLDELELGK